jgi:hypothetical protein
VSGGSVAPPLEIFRLRKAIATTEWTIDSHPEALAVVNLQHREKRRYRGEIIICL